MCAQEAVAHQCNDQELNGKWWSIWWKAVRDEVLEEYAGDLAQDRFEEALKYQESGHEVRCLGNFANSWIVGLRLKNRGRERETEQRFYGPMPAEPRSLSDRVREFQKQQFKEMLLGWVWKTARESKRRYALSFVQNFLEEETTIPKQRKHDELRWFQKAAREEFAPIWPEVQEYIHSLGGAPA